MDLLVPPLSYLALFIVFGVLTASLFASWWAMLPWLLALLLLTAYVMRGVSLAGPLASGLRDLLWAPAYVAWKLTLAIRSDKRSTNEWVRTEREKKNGE